MLPTRYCAPAEPSSLPCPSIGATRSGPSSATPMVISWRFPRHDQCLCIGTDPHCLWIEPANIPLKQSCTLDALMITDHLRCSPDVCWLTHDPGKRSASGRNREYT